MSDYAASIDVLATPDQVYSLWSDPGGWPQWDPDLESAALDGPFETGSTGSIKALGSPRTRIRLTKVHPGSSFVAEASLPGGRMVFEHTLEVTPTGCSVAHVVSFVGPLSRLYALLIGARIARGLPGTPPLSARHSPHH